MDKLESDHYLSDEEDIDIDLINDNEIFEDDYEKISTYEKSQNFFFSKENNEIKAEILSKVNKLKQEEIEHQTNEYNQKQRTFHKLNKLKLLLYQKFLFILIANINKLLKRTMNQLITGVKVKKIIKKGYSVSNQNNSTKLFINSMIKQEERKEKLKLISQKTFEKAKAIKNDEKKYLDNAKSYKDKLIIDKYKNEKFKNQLLIEKQKKLKEDFEKLKLKADGIYHFLLKRRYLNVLNKHRNINNTFRTCLFSRYTLYLKNTIIKSLLNSLNKKIEREKLKEKAVDITIISHRRKFMIKKYFTKIKVYLTKLCTKRSHLLNSFLSRINNKRKVFIFTYLLSFKQNLLNEYNSKLLYFRKLKKIKLFKVLKGQIRSIKESKQDEIEKLKLIERLNSIALGYLNN